MATYFSVRAKLAALRDSNQPEWNSLLERARTNPSSMAPMQLGAIMDLALPERNGSKTDDQLKLAADSIWRRLVRVPGGDNLTYNLAWEAFGQLFKHRLSKLFPSDADEDVASEVFKKIHLQLDPTHRWDRTLQSHVHQDPTEEEIEKAVEQACKLATHVRFVRQIIKSVMRDTWRKQKDQMLTVSLDQVQAAKGNEHDPRDIVLMADQLSIPQILSLLVVNAPCAAHTREYLIQMVAEFREDIAGKLRCYSHLRDLGDKVRAVDFLAPDEIDSTFAVRFGVPLEDFHAELCDRAKRSGNQTYTRQDIRNLFGTYLERALAA